MKRKNEGHAPKRVKNVTICKDILPKFPDKFKKVCQDYLDFFSTFLKID